MLHDLFPHATSHADRRVGAMLIAIGISIGIAMDGLIFNHLGIGVFAGVILGLAMYAIGMHWRQGRYN